LIEPPEAMSLIIGAGRRATITGFTPTCPQSTRHREREFNTSALVAAHGVAA